jgi:hypothetical protein
MVTYDWEKFSNAEHIRYVLNMDKLQAWRLFCLGPSKATHLYSMQDLVDVKILPDICKATAHLELARKVAITALVASSNSEHDYLNMTSEELITWIGISDDPVAICLLPLVKLRERP